MLPITKGGQVRQVDVVDDIIAIASINYVDVFSFQFSRQIIMEVTQESKRSEKARTVPN